MKKKVVLFVKKKVYTLSIKKVWSGEAKADRIATPPPTYTHRMSHTNNTTLQKTTLLKNHYSHTV